MSSGRSAPTTSSDKLNNDYATQEVKHRSLTSIRFLLGYFQMRHTEKHVYGTVSSSHILQEPVLNCKDAAVGFRCQAGLQGRIGAAKTKYPQIKSWREFFEQYGVLYVQYKLPVWLLRVRMYMYVYSDFTRHADAWRLWFVAILMHSYMYSLWILNTIILGGGGVPWIAATM